MRDIDTIDSELRLVAALRRAARERTFRPVNGKATTTAVPVALVVALGAFAD